MALILVAISLAPLSRFLSPPARGASYSPGPVFHTSSGHIFAIEYDSSLPQAQIDTATGYLNQYIPQLFALFWEPQEDAYIIVTQGGCGGYSCGGSDGVSILQSSWNYPTVWVHEFTHVLQFYGSGPGLYLSGEAFLLYTEPMAMATADILAPFQPPPDCCTDLSFWTEDQGVGLAAADYSLQATGESHVPVNAWRMLHEADPNIFKEINSRLYQLSRQFISLSDIPSFRELIRQSTQIQTLDNLSIRQWLAVEGFLSKNEIGTGPNTFIQNANYYSQSSTQQFAQVTAAVAISNNFAIIDKALSQGAVYDAITQTKLADLQVQSSSDIPHAVSFQANLALQSPPAMVRFDLHIVSGSYVDDRSILAPLRQYQSYLSTPSLGAQGLVIVPTSDMWLQNVNGNADINGQTYPVTNGIAKLNLGGPVTITVNTGTTTQITGFLRSQQLALGLDYTALRILQDTNTINSATQTVTQTFSTSSTPTVTIIETTSFSTIPSSSTSQTTQAGTATTTTNSTTTQISQNATVLTTSNSEASSSSTEQTSGTAITTTQLSSSTYIPQTSAADFQLSASSNMIDLAQSSSGAFTVSVVAIGLSDQQVHFEATGLPAGVQISFSPNPVTPSRGTTISSTATLTVTRSVPTGTYSFTLVASSGSASKEIPLTLRVSGCLIATATFGSELAPEVQFLRDFRDFKILQTFAGSSFMVAFNAWYYSFSPATAQYEYVQPAIRLAARFTLYPLIWVLEVGSTVFDLLSFNKEAAAVISGLAVSALLGAIYLTGPLVIVRLRLFGKRSTLRNLEAASGTSAVVFLIVLIFAELLRVELIMTIASSAAVLATLVTSALLTSRVLCYYCRRLNLGRTGRLFHI